MDKLKAVLSVYMAFIILLMYITIIMIGIFSFKSGAGISFPIEGWSLHWFKELFEDEAIMRSLVNSIVVSIVVTLITTPMCIALAIGLRKGGKIANLVFYVIMLGIIVPGLIYGLGCLMFYRMIGIDLSLWTCVPVLVIWTLPWGVILILARIDPQLIAYEEAAKVLGAGSFKVFKEVTLPLISPQVMAAALFAFILAWMELIRSAFVIGGHPTLPIWIYNTLTVYPPTPKFYALGFIITVVTIVILMAAGILMTKGRGKPLF